MEHTHNIPCVLLPVYILYLEVSESPTNELIMAFDLCLITAFNSCFQGDSALRFETLLQLQIHFRAYGVQAIII